jgi:hypothetical protein
MDPMIRIRIHPKMTWIRNTGFLLRGLTAEIRPFRDQRFLAKKGGVYGTAESRIFHRTPAGHTAERKTRRKRNRGC